MPAPTIAAALATGYNAGQITMAEVKAFTKAHGLCFSVWPEPGMYNIDDADEVTRIKWQTMHEFDDLSAILIIEPDYCRVLESGGERRFHSNEDPAVVHCRAQQTLAEIEALRRRYQDEH